jgi:TonB family protein
MSVIFCSASLCLCGVFLALAIPIAAQRVAILTPDQSGQTQKYASLLSDSLSSKLNVLDNEMSRSAFLSVKAENPFNLTAIQAKSIGEVIGCEYFLLVRSETLRRSSLNRDEYYESYITVFLVDTRFGRLVYWDVKSFEADKPAESERLLFASTDIFASEIGEHLETSRKRAARASGMTKIEEVPSADSPAAKNFHPPMPYKRIKPEYTRTAYLYDVRATVDVLVDIDQTGAVAAVWIERWAGFGLDESVIETIRKMNWRPATRNGKTLPMRVLLRYNFTKIEKE